MPNNPERIALRRQGWRKPGYIEVFQPSTGDLNDKRLLLI